MPLQKRQNSYRMSSQYHRENSTPATAYPRGDNSDNHSKHLFCRSRDMNNYNWQDSALYYIPSFKISW